MVSMSNLLNPCGILLVSRQRLLDRDLLSDATSLSQLSLPAQLQLVLLEFLPSERERDQEFLAACAENRVEPWLSFSSWFFTLTFWCPFIVGFCP